MDKKALSDEKDIKQMRDEELREFTKKFYARLEDIPTCAACPVEFCPRRKTILNENENSSDDED